MELNPGYKLTEAGVIAEDWECVESAAIATYFGGNGFKSEAAVSDGIRWLKIGNVGKQRAQWTDVSYLPHSYATNFQDYILREGDVVMALTRPILGNELKIAKLTELDVPSLLNQRVAKVIARSRADLAFIYYVLQTRHFVDSMKEAMAGTDPPNIGSRALGRIPIAVPPTVGEQLVIARALSSVDGLIGVLDKLIAKKRDLKQAVIQQLLTGNKRLPGFNSEWNVRRLGDLGSTFGGLTGKTKSDFGEGSARYITFMNIMTNVEIDPSTFEHVEVSPLESQNGVMKGDLFFNGSSETPEEVGMCAVLSSDVENVFLNSFCFGFRLREGAEADGRYLAHYFRSSEGRRLVSSLAQGATRYNLSKTNLLKLKFPIPKLPEQSAIADVLSDIDAEIGALVQRRNKTRALKQGMMQELLTGKTRLI